MSCVPWKISDIGCASHGIFGTRHNDMTPSILSNRNDTFAHWHTMYEYVLLGGAHTRAAASDKNCGRGVELECGSAHRESVPMLTPRVARHRADQTIQGTPAALQACGFFGPAPVVELVS